MSTSSPTSLTPFPYQAEALRRVQEEFASGRQRTLVVMPTGCHHPNQHLLLPDGLSGMACNIHEGDVLLGPDSTPRHVVAVHEGEAPMYRIIPVKGEPFIVTGDHLLTLVRTNETSLPRFPCRSRGGEVVDVTVEDWLLWPDWRKHIHKLFRVPVEFTVPVSWATGFDPYLAGVLLGDGSLQSGRNVGVTSADSEMEVYCHSVARQYGATIRKSDVGGRCPTYFFRAAVRGETNRFLEAVRENGLYWMDSGTKYIPMQFRAGSLLDRYELLAGLMDTDGSLSCNGYDYPTKSSTLAYDVAFVARSVGLAAYVQECWKSCQTGAGGTYYRVSISGHTDMIPCRLPRKKASPRQQIKDVLRTGFTVEPLGVGEYRGFTVDGDNRYLLGDFTVTHNCGKTHTAAFLFRENVGAGGRNLFLTHRDPLVHQAFADLGSVGLDCAVEKGDQDARDDIERARHDIFRPRDIRTVVASVQTLHERRLPRWPRDYFDLVTVDEAHHSSSGSYRRILDHFDSARVVGLTATPDRMDGERLPFDSKAFEYRLDEAIGDGWLVPLFQERCNQKIDLRGLRCTGGDFSVEALEDRISAQIGPLVNGARERLGARPAIAFTPDVKSARAFADGLTAVGIPARAVWGDCYEKAGVLRAFQDQAFQVLVNCAICTEGYNAPWVQAVILARPTKSRGLLAQMVGRGTRRYEGKDSCMLLDYSWLVDEHDLASPVTLLSPPRLAKLPEPQRQRAEVLAQEMVESGYEPDLLAAMDLAAGQVERAVADETAAAEAQERERLRVFVKARDSGLTWTRRDPLGVPVRAILGLPPVQEATISPPAMASQVNALVALGVPADEARRTTCSEAAEAARELIRRQDRGLASLKQIRVLLDNGFSRESALSMTKGEASWEIDAIFRARKATG
jgi:superfamily II DNA or RNA helicase